MTASSGVQSFVIPEEPDCARMHRDISARLRSAMADHGVDALILLMNDNVVYSTGASWPVLDAGLSHVERPVAIVLADDPHPHLFLPFRSGAASESQVPQDHLHDAALPRIGRGRRAVRAGDRGVDSTRGRRRGRRDDRGDAPRRRPDLPRRPAVGGRRRDRSVQPRQDTGSGCLSTQGQSYHRTRDGRRPSNSSRPVCGRPICRPSWYGARSNWARPPTCSKRSGR